MEALATLSAEIRARRSLPSPEECRAIRERAGVTLARVAEPCGVSATAVWEWETKATIPRREHLIAYLEVLRVMQEAAA